MEHFPFGNMTIVSKRWHYRLMEKDSVNFMRRPFCRGREKCWWWGVIAAGEKGFFLHHHCFLFLGKCEKGREKSVRKREPVWTSFSVEAIDCAQHIVAGQCALLWGVSCSVFICFPPCWLSRDTKAAIPFPESAFWRELSYSGGVRWRVGLELMLFSPQ